MCTWSVDLEAVPVRTITLIIHSMHHTPLLIYLESGCGSKTGQGEGILRSCAASFPLVGRKAAALFFFLSRCS